MCNTYRENALLYLHTNINKKVVKEAILNDRFSLFCHFDSRPSTHDLLTTEYIFFSRYALKFILLSIGTFWLRKLKVCNILINFTKGVNALNIELNSFANADDFFKS